MLLIAGGDQDPQLARFRTRVSARGIAHRTLFHGMMGNPQLIWDIDTGKLRDELGEIAPTSAFIRQDVFRFLASNKPQDREDGRAWKVLVDGFLGSLPEVRMFNRAFFGKEAVNKPLTLVWARDAGFEIPKTVVHASKLRGLEMVDGPTIYKPIAGGDMCRMLEREGLEKVPTAALPRPYIFQECLEAPELRVFRVGDQLFGFDVAANALDYRTVGDAKITPVEVPEHLRGPMFALADRVGLTYAAADFKMCPETKAFKFLEINSNPMFAGFDEAAGGVLVDAMIDYLVADAGSKSEASP